MGALGRKFGGMCWVFLEAIPYTDIFLLTVVHTVNEAIAILKLMAELRYSLFNFVKPFQKEPPKKSVCPEQANSTRCIKLLLLINQCFSVKKRNT